MALNTQHQNQLNRLSEMLKFTGMNQKTIRAIYYELSMQDGYGSLINQGRKVTLKELFFHRNLFDLYRDVYPKWDNELVLALAQNNLGGSVNVGECENILVLTGKDAKFVREGDLSIEGMSIEVKCGGGHMCGQGITVGDVHAYHDNGVDQMRIHGIDDLTDEWVGERAIGRMIREIFNHDYGRTLSYGERSAILFNIIYRKALGLYGSHDNANEVASKITEALMRLLVPRQIGVYTRNSKHHKKGEPKYQTVLDRDLGKVYINIFGIWQAFMYTLLSNVGFLILFNKKLDYEIFKNDGDFDDFFMNMNGSVVCSKGPTKFDNMCKATVVALK